MRVNKNCSLIKKHLDKRGILNLINVLNEEKETKKRPSSNMLGVLLKENFSNSSFVKKLIDMGCRINEEDKYGQTPIFHAVKFNNIDICKTLLENGADVNHPDFMNNTPLTKAAMRGSIQLIDLLIKHGADINHENDYGATALKVACEERNLHVARHLINFGATFNDERKWVYGDTREIDNNGQIYMQGESL